MRKITLCLLLVMGCGWVKEKIPVLADSPEEKVKQEESVRLEKEAAAKRLRDADNLVQLYSDQLAQKTHRSGGFIHQEGLTETDPWGNFLKVGYHQDGFSEVLTVRSAGADGKFDTIDDLVRHRETTNIFYFYRGMNWWQWFLIVWIGSAVLGTMLYLWMGSIQKNKNRKRKRPIAGVFIVCLLGPFALLIYSVMVAVSIVGHITGHELDFDFDLGNFDFDFDFDFD